MTLSDFNNLDKVYVKEPKKEKENEDEVVEDVETKHYNDPSLSFFSNGELSKILLKQIKNHHQNKISTMKQL